MSPKRSRCDDAVEWMRHQIENDQWPLNSQIPTQAQLVRESGFTLPVVRQAISVLINNGLLESARGRGTYVRELSALSTVLLDHLSTQPPQWTLSLRRAIEVEAAGLAASNRTDEQLEALRASLTTPAQSCWTSTFDAATGRTLVNPDSFHAAVFAASGNPLIADIHRSAITSLRRAGMTPAPGQRRDIVHLEIFKAIERGDATAAQQAAGRHAGRDLPRT
ncbi:FadR/GntR family transcriptional regulator [Lentzea sp. NPDC058436]|uniref:FadR/GntR family transcriptional regulator n=1 Tax=Lentzea sp. NPDC058436 TaxID=3346499 RepID=UPI003665F5C6